MALNPVPVLAIVLFSLAFQGLLFGQTLAEKSFPEFEEPREGLFGALDAVLNLVKGVWGVIVFFFNLVTFNVPGAPGYVRFVVGGIHGGALIWSIAGMFRGT